MTIFWHKLGKEKDLKVNTETMYINKFTGDIGVRVLPAGRHGHHLGFFARCTHQSHFINQASEEGFSGEAESAERIGSIYLCQDPMTTTIYESLLNDIAQAYTQGCITERAMNNFTYTMLWWAIHVDSEIRESVRQWAPNFLNTINEDLKIKSDFSPEFTEKDD